MDLGENIFFDSDSSPQLPTKLTDWSGARDSEFRPLVETQSHRNFNEAERSVMRSVQSIDSVLVNFMQASDTRTSFL